MLLTSINKHTSCFAVHFSTKWAIEALLFKTLEKIQAKCILLAHFFYNIAKSPLTNTTGQKFCSNSGQ